MRLHRSRMGIIAHPVILAIVVIVLAVGVLSFVPSGSCNVTATVSMTESQFIIGSYYSVNGVSAQSTGYSSILNWGTAGFTLPALSANIVLTVSVAGHSTSKSETKFLPTLSIGVNQQISDTISVGYVPTGQQTVVATLTVGGAQQGSASQTIDVGCPA